MEDILNSNFILLETQKITNKLKKNRRRWEFKWLEYFVGPRLYVQFLHKYLK